MKFRLALAFLIVVSVPTANAVTPIKVIATTPTTTFSLGSNSSIVKSIYTSSGVVLIGTIGETSNQKLVSGNGFGKTDGFIAKIAQNGGLIWSSRLGGSLEDIATSVIADSDNTFWVLGASESSVALTTAETNVIVINPDSITVSKETNRSLGLLTTNVWHISASGELIGTIKYQSVTPIMPRDLATSPDGLVIVGDLMVANGRVGQVLFCNLASTCNVITKIGVRGTSIRGILRNQDGTYFLIGKSVDPILKTKLIGVVDGVILALNSKGVLKSVVRSSLPKTSRSWETVSDSYLLGGFAQSTKISEATITQFNQSAKPLWSIRINATTSALTAGNSAILVSKGGIPTLTNWKPKSATLIFLEFDNKGAIKVARSISGGRSPVSISYQRATGYSIIAETGVENEYSVTFVPSTVK